MIRVDFTCREELLARYTDLVINPLEEKCLDLLNRVPKPYSDNLRDLITGEGLKELILLSPDKLILKIDEFYSLVPILAERYCLEYSLSALNLEPEFLDMNISTKASKSLIQAYKEEVINQLNDLLNIEESVVIFDVISSLKSTNVASEIKKYLNRLNNFKSGNYLLNKKELGLFDNWVHELAIVFDYDSMAKKFASELTKELDINICPYCNYEDTETFGDDICTTRPDLDHFHPKAKFPFLSLTLSNLLPAGEKCNQKYKRNRVMLDYRNPYIDGISDNTLFDFEYPPDQGATVQNLVVKVNDDKNFSKNFELFNFKNLYNKKDIKETFVDIFTRNKFIMCLDKSDYEKKLSDVKAIHHDLNVDLTVPIKDRRLQKFKIDTLRKVTGRKFSPIK